MSKKVLMYTYRVYPNQTQKNLINRTFKVCNEIHNLILKERAYVYNKFVIYVERCLINKIKIDEERFFKHNPPKKIDMFKKLNNDYSKIDEVAIYNEQLSVINAYERYFSGIDGFPRYKDYRSKKIYNTNNINNSIRVNNKTIILPKLGLLKAKIDRSLPKGSNIKKAVVKSDKNGKYYVGLIVEFI